MLWLLFRLIGVLAGVGLLLSISNKDFGVVYDSERILQAIALIDGWITVLAELVEPRVVSIAEKFALQVYQHWTSVLPLMMLYVWRDCSTFLFLGERGVVAIVGILFGTFISFIGSIFAGMVSPETGVFWSNLAIVLFPLVALFVYSLVIAGVHSVLYREAVAEHIGSNVLPIGKFIQGGANEAILRYAFGFFVASVILCLPWVLYSSNPGVLTLGILASMLALFYVIKGMRRAWQRSRREEGRFLSSLARDLNFNLGLDMLGVVVGFLFLFQFGQIVN